MPPIARMCNRINLDTIGFFLYMEEQEEIERRSRNEKCSAAESVPQQKGTNGEKNQNPEYSPPVCRP